MSDTHTAMPDRHATPAVAPESVTVAAPDAALVSSAGLRVLPIPPAILRALRAGGPDANGRPPERTVSDGGGNPCRCCLHDIPEGAPMLVLAHRPFATLQPYAEVGPVFVCAGECAPWRGDGLPPVLAARPAHVLRGYGAGERIVYGTGGIVATRALGTRASALLARPDVAFLHVRSAVNGCFLCRIGRGALSGTAPWAKAARSPRAAPRTGRA